MNITITGKELKATDAIKDYVEKKLTRIEKYFGEETIGVTVTIKKENVTSEIAEMYVTVKGLSFKAVTEDKDLYASIDKDIDILEGQIRKAKAKRETAQTVGIYGFLLPRGLFHLSERKEPELRLLSSTYPSVTKSFSVKVKNLFSYITLIFLYNCNIPNGSCQVTKYLFVFLFSALIMSNSSTGRTIVLKDSLGLSEIRYDSVCNCSCHSPLPCGTVEVKSLGRVAQIPEFQKKTGKNSKTLKLFMKS